MFTSFSFRLDKIRQFQGWQESGSVQFSARQHLAPNLKSESDTGANTISLTDSLTDSLADSLSMLSDCAKCSCARRKYQILLAMRGGAAADPWQARSESQHGRQHTRQCRSS